MKQHCGVGRGGLEAEGSLQVTASKKLDLQTHRCKALNSADNLSEFTGELLPSPAS